MMHSLRLTFIGLLAGGFMLAQENPSDKTETGPGKVPKHELGLDLSTFVKYYLNFQGGTGYSARTPYMLTYRHYGLKRNLRAAISIGYETSDNPSPYNGDPTRYHKQQGDFMGRFGYEWYQDLNKRWQVYYGVDLRCSYSYMKNEGQFYNAGYIYGYEGATVAAGVAPVLGFRFRLNDRLSLLTESSFLIQYSNNWNQRFNKPVTPAYPVLEQEVKTISSSFGTSFSAPTLLVLAVSF